MDECYVRNVPPSPADTQAAKMVISAHGHQQRVDCKGHQRPPKMFSKSRFVRDAMGPLREMQA